MIIGDLCKYAPKSSIKAGEAEIDGKYMFFTSSTDENKRYSDFQLDCEGIIMGTGGNATLHYYNGKFSTSTDCVVLLPNDKIRCKYLYYFFLHNMPLLQAGFKGAGLKHTNKNYINNITISSLPTIQTQDETINVLDKVSNIISSHQQQLQKLDELVKSRFIELFGDPATPGEKFKTSKLGEVADVKSSHRVFTTEFVDEGVPFYRGTEIGALASGQQPENPYRISMEHYLKIASDDSKPKRGDLLLPSICNKGQIWMVDTDEPFYYKDGRVLCISPVRSVFDSRYLQFYMKIRTEAEYPKLGSGSTFAEFKIFQLKELEVDIPPINAQKEFNLFADQVDKSKFEIKKSIENISELIKSLMQQDFTN